MRQPSMVIHKGKKEEKYEIYVEDYVISFLKGKADGPGVPEILFYGCRDRGGRQYTIYGAGQDRHLAVFDKYDLLEEVGCRITQAGPVFLIREANGTYEVKGYKVFYYENEEMQDYLIRQDREEHKKTAFRNRNPAAKGPAGRKTNPHYVISLQMGIVFLVLVAIVINSANSYDKMEQLNQSAAEVFFVMENQEADEAEETGKESAEGDIVVERNPLEEGFLQNDILREDASQDNILQDNVLAENRQQEQQDGTASGQEAGPAADTTADGEDMQAKAEAPEAGADSHDQADTQPGADKSGDSAGNQQAADGPADTADAQAEINKTENESGASQETGEENGENEGQTAQEEEGVEALSRNVARYYEVKRGDTLYLISQKIYGDTAHVKKICEINQITDPDNIRYGQKIILP